MFARFSTTLNGSKPRSALERLPLEISQCILATLDDVFSLRSTALTCRFLFHALLNAEETITSQVLLKHLNPGILRDAVFAKDSSRLKVWPRCDVLEFLSQYLGQRETLCMRWKLSEAIPMAELYNNIHHLALDFSSEAMATSGWFVCSWTRFDRVPTPLSSNEVDRIERTLYRFEIYCNLFRDAQPPPFILGREQRDVFLSKLSPWENEQLACIHDYLARAVEQAMRKVSQNDPNWFSYMLEQWHGSSRIQYQISLGLAHVRRLIDAKTYETRQELLAGDSNKKTNSNFLAVGLDSATFGSSISKLYEYDSEDERKYITRPAFPDPDPGPEAAWRWAHHQETSIDFIYSSAGYVPREWAYVMWDMTRLEAWKVFEHPWEKPSL